MRSGAPISGSRDLTGLLDPVDGEPALAIEDAEDPGPNLERCLHPSVREAWELARLFEMPPRPGGRGHIDTGARAVPDTDGEGRRGGRPGRQVAQRPRHVSKQGRPGQAEPDGLPRHQEEAVEGAASGCFRPLVGLVEPIEEGERHRLVRRVRGAIHAYDSAGAGSGATLGQPLSSTS